MRSRLRPITQADISFMLEHVVDRNGCSEWIGKFENGLPYYRGYRVRRILWDWYNEPCIKVSTSCLNSKCVNPEHLIDSSRPYKPDVIRLGEVNGNHKLTEVEVLQIARRLNETNKSLGLDFGVHRDTIQQIRSGKTWNWLTKINCK